MNMKTLFRMDCLALLVSCSNPRIEFAGENLGASDRDSILYDLNAPSCFPEGYTIDILHSERLKSVFDGSSGDNYVVWIVRLKKKTWRDILL